MFVVQRGFCQWKNNHLLLKEEAIKEKYLNWKEGKTVVDQHWNFLFVLHRSLLTLFGRRALVCFNKVSITLTSARKLKLRLEQLSSAVERSFLCKYLFFLLLRDLPVTRVLMRRDSSFCGFKRWLRFFFTISLLFDTDVVVVAVVFFFRPYPCLCHVSYCPKVRSGMFFSLTRSFILFNFFPYPEFTSKECDF